MKEAGELTDCIDLRSDASTLPTEAMRQVMATCAVGNDDFSEDPEIQALEEQVAVLLEKEAALFLQSGTMANLVAVMSQVEEEQSVLISEHFHIFDHEGPAMRRIARCRFCPAEDETADGLTRIKAKAAFERCAPSDRPRLLCLENSVNRLGGTLLALQHVRELSAWAHDQGMTVHLDGARLFNAAAALGIDAARLAASVDTVMFVFTKTLSAPAGAALAGSADLVER